ncbi:hypothetical protein [Streptomyces mirabilis]|uniref:hypothetical protein n=1 Tax=Streptomyces mirabilis TaxID=68239 RepID=UPI0036628672
MAETWDEEQLIVDGFERVYVELEWYDGPREGIADVNGVPHYFQSHDYDHLDDADEYRVWPASEDALALEREQWSIFARWDERHKAGAVGPDSHPGHGGIDVRYDELTALLVQHRQAPGEVRQLLAQWRFVSGARYRIDGVDYRVKWSPVGEAAVDH